MANRNSTFTYPHYNQFGEKTYLQDVDLIKRILSTGEGPAASQNLPTSPHQFKQFYRKSFGETILSITSQQTLRTYSSASLAAVKD